MFVEVVQVNGTWISSDDGDQYSITREEIHDNNKILVQAANNEQENWKKSWKRVGTMFIGGENHRPVTSLGQTLSHNVSSTPCYEQGSNSTLMVIGTDWKCSYKLTWSQPLKII